MAKKILISEIKINRDLRDGDDLSDMDQLVLAQPIVVTKDKQLIDGLRRVRLAEKLGVPDMPAEFVSNLEEMASALAKQHPTPILDWDRIIELLKFLRPAAEARWRLIKQSTIAQNRVVENRQIIPRPKGPARPYITKALGGVSPAHWEVVEKVFQTASPDVVALIRERKLSPSGAVNRMHRITKGGNIIEPRDQEALLESAAQAIRSAVRSFEKLHRPLTLDAVRLRELREDLYKSRSALTSFINQSEEAAK